LLAAGPKRYAKAISGADQWLRSSDSKRVVDLSATAISLQNAADELGQRKLQQTIVRLLELQHHSGGWGPFAGYRPEVFDTAIVLVALAPRRKEARVATAIDRGQMYLLETQLEDGTWDETTRPSGNVSYAHRVSTTAWAAMALLVTSDER
jgi:hypothetical protein